MKCFIKYKYIFYKIQFYCFKGNGMLWTKYWNQCDARFYCKILHTDSVRSKSKLLLLLTIKLEVKVINQCNPRGCVFNCENIYPRLRTVTRAECLRRKREGEQGKLPYETIIFSYEKFKVRSSRNINHVKVASKKVLSANLAYANTGEQSG